MLKNIDILGKNINRIFDRRKGLYVALLMFAFLIIYAFMNTKIFIYNDAYNYYTFSSLFIKNGKFAFSNYDNALRGYNWPLLLLPIRIISETFGRNPATVYRLVFAFVASGFFGSIMPNGIERVFKTKINFLQRLLFISMLLFFWMPTFLQPLSDMPTFMCNIAGIFLLYYASDEKKIWRKYVYMILAGMALASTSLFRPVYQFSLPLGAVLFIILNLKKEKRKNLYLLFPLIIGAILMFLPQVIINVKNFGIFTPYAQAQSTLDGRLLRQLGLGVVSSGSFGYIGDVEIPIGYIEKETFRNVDVLTTGPKMIFVNNRHGFVLLNKLGIEKTNGLYFLSYKEYISYAIKYPLDFLTIWGTHLFYGLDLNFHDLYHVKIGPNSVLYSLLNYTALFFAAKTMAVKGWFKNGGFAKTIGLIMLFFPCIVAMAVNMEERFMMPVHILAYMLIAFNPNIKEMLTKKHKFSFGLIIVYILFVATFFMLSATLLSEVGFLLH